MFIAGSWNRTYLVLEQCAADDETVKIAEVYTLFRTAVTTTKTMPHITNVRARSEPTLAFS